MPNCHIFPTGLAGPVHTNIRQVSRLGKSADCQIGQFAILGNHWFDTCHTCGIPLIAQSDRSDCGLCGLRFHWNLCGLWPFPVVLRGYTPVCRAKYGKPTFLFGNAGFGRGQTRAPGG
eukprot:6325730-Prymnesium_polylepis.1